MNEVQLGTHQSFLRYLFVQILVSEWNVYNLTNLNIMKTVMDVVFYIQLLSQMTGVPSGKLEVRNSQEFHRNSSNTDNFKPPAVSFLIGPRDAFVSRKWLHNSRKEATLSAMISPMRCARGTDYVLSILRSNACSQSLRRLSKVSLLSPYDIVGEQHSFSESLGSFSGGIDSKSQVDHSESASDEINSGQSRYPLEYRILPRHYSWRGLQDDTRHPDRNPGPVTKI
ncbi:hypothetical protein B0H12DRAFT_1079624 [Mycena haematopus]|nr:hypothetical protein B0H12DRAFT_1079624 [Mycena haematopus]